MKCSWSIAFQIFVTPMRSGDTCDQSRKFSKIAPNFEHFCPLKFCWEQPSQKLYTCYHACLAVRQLVKFHGVIPTSSKIIGSHALNFKPNFKCSPLICFFGGRGDPTLDWDVRYQALVNRV